MLQSTARRTAALATATLLAGSAFALGPRAPVHANGTCDTAAYGDGCAAPANVYNSVSGQNVQLTWQMPSFAAVPYAQAIERGTSPFQFSPIKIFASGPVQTSYTDQNVPAGKYYYEVCNIYPNYEDGSEYDACSLALPEGVTVTAPSKGNPPAGNNGGSGGKPSGNGSTTPSTPPATVVPIQFPPAMTVSDISYDVAIVHWGMPTGTIGSLQVLCQDLTDPTTYCGFPKSGQAGQWWLGQQPRTDQFPQEGVADWPTGQVPASAQFRFWQLTAGHSYRVQVCADQSGLGLPNPSAPVCATAVRFQTLLGLSNLHVVDRDGDHITLGWSDPSAIASSYVITRDGAQVGTIAVDPAPVSCADPRLCVTPAVEDGLQFTDTFADYYDQTYSYEICPLRPGDAAPAAGSCTTLKIDRLGGPNVLSVPAGTLPKLGQ
jgi:hypothetical protein